MIPLKYISVCAGIESASVAWSPRWQPVAFSEIDPFASQVLAHHYPDVLNLGDMLQADWGQYYDRAEILIGGTPCQAFSVAGNRKSLSDDRGNLTLKFTEIRDAVNPSITIWENVPGVLNTPDNAFGCLLGRLLGESGPLLPKSGQRKWANSGFCLGQTGSVAWTVKDAQYFGVSQRRRRVFLVAVDFRKTGRLVEAIASSSHSLVNSNDNSHPIQKRDRLPGGINTSDDNLQLFRQRLAGLPAAILFEPEVQAGNSAAIAEEQGQSTRGAEDCVGGIDSSSLDLSHDGIFPTLTRSNSTRFVAHRLDKRELVGGVDSNSPNLVRQGICPTLTQSHSSRFFIAEKINKETLVAFNAKRDGHDAGPLAPTLRAAAYQDSHANSGAWVGIAGPSFIRRLTPTECHRLQGFPDNYLQIPYKGKPAPDGPQYKALGNAIAVPCLNWLQQRIDKCLTTLAAELW